MQVCRCNKSAWFFYSTTLSRCRVGWRQITPQTGSRWFIPLRLMAGGSRGWSGTAPVSVPPPSTRPAVPGRTAQQVAGPCITLTRLYLFHRMWFSHCENIKYDCGVKLQTSSKWIARFQTIKKNNHIVHYDFAKGYLMYWIPYSCKENQRFIPVLSFSFDWLWTKTIENKCCLLCNRISL